ncbi:MAG: hypothetical protein OHK0012_18350 [Synechococcales cyanobacterium]
MMHRNWSQLDEWLMASEIVHLLTIRDPEGQRTLVLENAAYAIGRDPGNGIVLHSPKVSRQHALLLRIPNPQQGGYRYQLMDGNAEGQPSKNGLKIFGKSYRVRILENGDVVEFATGVTLTYSACPADDLAAEHQTDYRSIKVHPTDARKTVMLSQTNAPVTVPIVQPKPAPVERPKSGGLWEKMKGLLKHPSEP